MPRLPSSHRALYPTPNKNGMVENMMNIIKKFGYTGKRSILSRVLLALVLLLVLGSCLTACGGGRATVTLDPVTITVDEDSDHGLDTTQINTLAEAIASNKNSLLIREQLVAALNGYDMTAEDFDDDNLPEAQPDKAGEFAFKVITHEDYDIENSYVYEKINAVDVKALVDCFKTTVTPTAELGFFDQILHWIALGFEWLINVPGFGSFILGTLYFALVVELLMLPLSIHQQKNSRKQALLRPKEMAIRKKYAGRNDQATQQKVTQEIQEMYQKEGFSPMAGCLPMLISLPVVMMLYYIVIDPMKYMLSASTELSTALHYFVTASKAAGGLGIELQSSNGTIELLSHIRADGLAETILEAMPNFQYFNFADGCFTELGEMFERIPDFSIFGVNFGLNPDIMGLFENFTNINNWLVFVPVITFLLYFFSMKLNRKLSFQPAAQDQATGCSNKMMDVTMPLMSAWFTFMVPGAVGMYWGFKSVMGMIKSVVIAKVMPLPKFTEADFKAAENELKAKEKHRPVKKNPGGNPNVRSLHHIDDDDDLEPLPKIQNKGDYVETEEPVKEEAKGAYLGDATLKEDDRPTKEAKKKNKKSKESLDAEADNEPKAQETTDTNTDHNEEA